MDWEQAIFDGIEARRQRDGGQWKLGDLALGIETRYGEHTLERYAEQIGEVHSTLEDYRRVAEAFEKPLRNGNLTFNHHRMIAARPDRLDWLATASEQRWSVRQMLDSIRTYDLEQGRVEAPSEEATEAAVDVAEGLIEQFQGALASMADAASSEVEEMNALAPKGFNVDEERERQHRTQRFYASIETLAQLPPPPAFIKDIPDYQRERVERNLRHVINWLEQFIKEWESVKA